MVGEGPELIARGSEGSSRSNLETSPALPLSEHEFEGGSQPIVV